MAHVSIFKIEWCFVRKRNDLYQKRYMSVEPRAQPSRGGLSPISDQVFDQAAAITFKFSTRADMQTTCRYLTPMTQSDSHNPSFPS